jgi:hypothetical protein
VIQLKAPEKENNLSSLIECARDWDDAIISSCQVLRTMIVSNDDEPLRGSGASLLTFFNSDYVSTRTLEEVDKAIEEERNSWD